MASGSPQKSMDENIRRERDNLVRLEGLKNAKSHSKFQQDLIAGALKFSSIGDAGKRLNKKFIFQDGLIKSNDKSKVTKSVPLFDDEDGGEVPQFDLNKPNKVVELQSRFANDSRFKINSRFLDDGEENNGDQFAGGERNDERRPNKFSFGAMTRYDPANPEHVKKYELPNPKKIHVKEQEGPVKKKAVESEIIPVVNKERFYEVSSSLKQAFEESSSTFRLGTLINAAENQSDDEELDMVTQEDTEIPTKKIGDNPFIYDSSSSEDEMESEVTKVSVVTTETTPKDSVRETFFFYSIDDPRLDEGKQFIVKRRAVAALSLANGNRIEKLNQVLGKKRRFSVKKTKDDYYKQNSYTKRGIQKKPWQKHYNLKNRNQSK